MSMCMGSREGREAPLHWTSLLCRLRRWVAGLPMLVGMKDICSVSQGGGRRGIGLSSLYGVNGDIDGWSALLSSSQSGLPSIFAHRSLHLLSSLPSSFRSPFSSVLVSGGRRGHCFHRLHPSSSFVSPPLVLSFYFHSHQHADQQRNCPSTCLKAADSFAHFINCS
jgi:hypothetical protein